LDRSGHVLLFREVRRKLLSCHPKYLFAAFVVSGLLLGRPAICLSQQEHVTATEHETTYKYDTPGIKLDGTLIERKVYGPPGYGETPAKDAWNTIFILKLPHGISVEPAVNAEASGSANLDSAPNVREVQLFIARAQVAAAQKLIGHLISADGTLNESLTASQYTKVWLDVKTLFAK
jgi:hypothetical protein